MWPFILGGTSGSCLLECMVPDTSWNIIVGGQATVTSGTGIVPGGGTTYPIIAYVTINGGLKWHKYIKNTPT